MEKKKEKKKEKKGGGGGGGGVGGGGGGGGVGGWGGGEWTCFCNSYKHVHNASFSVDNAGGTKCLTRDASKQVKYKKKKKEH